MTKGFSLSTTTAKVREALLAPAGPASRPGDDDGQVDSFATLLDSAVPTKHDEPEGERASDSPKRTTEREQSHKDEGETTYFAPADLALAWLASSDLTALSKKRLDKAEDAPGTAEIPRGGSTGEAASAATDPPDSSARVADDEEAPGADDVGVLLVASLRPGSPPGASRDMTGSRTEASSGYPATSSDRHRDEATTYLTGALAKDRDDSFELRPGSATPSGQAQRAADASFRSGTTNFEESRSAGREATPPAPDARRLSGGSSSSGASRGRELPATPETDRPDAARTTSNAASPTPEAMPSPEVPSRPAWAASRSSGPAEPNNPEQANGGTFMAENTELSAAITKAQRGADGSYRVTALLNPPSLGRVDATIKVSGESVVVAITPHTAEGHDALSRHLDELQRELASEHGEVHLSLAGGGGQARHGNDPRYEPVAPQTGDEADLRLDSLASSPDSSLHIIL